MKKLNMPTVRGNFDSSKRFSFEKPSHSLRVYAFEHGGEDHLATTDVIHFLPGGGAPKACTGADCAYCKEAVALDIKMAQSGTKGKERNRLKAVTRYPIIVVDTEAKEYVPMRYDAPQTVYQSIFNMINDPRNGGPELLGNEGTDFIISYNPKAMPAQQYSVTLRLKNNIKLAIDKVPDLIAEVEYWKEHGSDPIVSQDSGTGGGGAAPAEGAGDSGSGEIENGTIVFTGKDNQEKKGKFTGKMRAGNYVVECEGRIVQVSPDAVIFEKSGIENPASNDNRPTPF